MTEKYFVTGHPVAHSLSPVIHGVFFEHFNIGERYTIKDILPCEFKSKMAEFRKSEVKGFNVTIPHKISAYESADVLEPFAQKVGAVNTVKIENKKLYGFNTDGVGFIKAIEKCGVCVKGKTVCIIGAGGAVNSIAVKLNLEGAEKIIILARRKEQAQALCQKHGFGIADCIDNFEKYSYDILVNATPVGMHPNEGVSPIKSIKNCELVYDLIYNPAKTEFLKMAEQKNIAFDNGLWMLVLQAAAAFEIWTGFMPDDAALNKAYKKVLAALEEK
ncbi:MAG: shikimate dehydrogenase [Clostridia bacterium]|nr:shikimate dehydrogenase [Clostridia bacterium]